MGLMELNWFACGSSMVHDTMAPLIPWLIGTLFSIVQESSTYIVLEMVVCEELRLWNYHVEQLAAILGAELALRTLNIISKSIRRSNLPSELPHEHWSRSKYKIALPPELHALARPPIIRSEHAVLPQNCCLLEDGCYNLTLMICSLASFCC